MALKPIQFIDEPIEVQFDRPQFLEKTPGCPDRFVWQGQTYRTAEMLSQWTDFSRRGRMEQNMQPAHAAVAARRGSWGVGRFFFRVRTQVGRIFDLYYDRAPKDAGHRKGEWFLFRELSAESDESQK
jgi:hypothetical protein